MQMSQKLSPFYVYNLPKTLLTSLSQIAHGSTEILPSGTGYHDINLTPSTVPLSSSKTEERQKSCSTCSYLASNVEDQRSHYRSDFHKFNLRRKISGLPIVTEDEFELILDDLELSISGSSSDSEDDFSTNQISEYMSRTRLEPINENEDSQLSKRSPFLAFKSELIPEDEALLIYSCLFPTGEEESVLDTIKTKQRSNFQEPPISAIFMAGGGHFAGAIISHALNDNNKNDPVVLIEHKTFHRYTTRRKQGGSQSASDNAHGKAHSAGSNLRRYNEAALEKEVHELLDSWKHYIDRADNIFIRVNGKQNRQLLVGYENAPISKKDIRVKRIPFSTRRATGSEVKRVWLELTRPKIVPVSSLMQVRTKPKTKEAPKQQFKEYDDAEELREPSAEELHTSQITTLIRKSRISSLINYIRGNNLSPDFTFEPKSEYYHTPTALHLASSLSIPRVVSALLLSLNADPTIRNGEGRTAWEICGDRITRDAFRLARGELGESKWNWSKSGVSSALSKKEIEEREVREKQAAQRERDEAVKKLEKAQLSSRADAGSTSKGRKLASSIVTDIGSEAQLSGLNAEARMKVERERRARAVEARLKTIKK
ncbi:hypothetical protein V1511DRAFT_321180 [Dipodascopsis uninucleata]